jgi:hypothetical protein
MDKDELINLDRVPTMDELREFFKSNDWSTANLADFDTLPQEDIECIASVSKLINKKWDKLAYEKGLNLSPYKSHKEDNSLLKLRNQTTLNIGGALNKLLNEKPEELEEVLGALAESDPALFEPANADIFLENAVNTLMDVMQYEELAKVFKETPAQEDFNNGESNLRSIDFYRKWNHTRSKYKTVSTNGLDDKTDDEGNFIEYEVPDKFSAKVDDSAVGNIVKNDFWGTLNETDKKLLNLRMQGYTQVEIADMLAYKTHSAVTKRLEKLKVKFNEKYEVY